MKFIIATLIILSSLVVHAQDSAQQLFDHYRSSLFQIQIIEKGSGTKSAIGSGFLIGDDQFIATNYHVVSEYIHFPNKYRIQYLSAQGSEGELELHDFDVANDLALLKASSSIDSNNSLQLAVHLPNQGNAIYSLGNPHDLGMIVVPGTFNGLKKSSFYQRIHFTGSINPGMSGGPVVNSDGEVVGVNVATAGNQIGFLIPLSKLTDLVTRYKGKIEQEDFKQRINQQLLHNQKRLVDSLLENSWKQSTLGQALVPDAVTDFMSCWGDSNAEDENAQYLSVENRCRLGEQIYVDQHFRSGAVEMEFEWLESTHFSEAKFYRFFSERVSSAGPGNQATKEDVSNFKCQNNTITNSNNVTSKTVLCLRSYKDYGELYDVFFIGASLDHKTSGLISHFTLSGVTKQSAMSFTQRFMESIAWR